MCDLKLFFYDSFEVNLCKGFENHIFMMNLNCILIQYNIYINIKAFDE